MRAFALLILLLLGAAAAQQPALSIAFVQNSRVLAAHPAGQQVAALSEQATAELQEIATELQPLLVKRNAGETLSAEEQDRLELAERTYQETQERYQQEIAAAGAPATEAINAIIQTIAEENGYTLVLNKEIAATSQLVVYGDPSIPDITEEVIERIEAEAGASEGE